MTNLRWKKLREYGSDKHFTCWGELDAEIEGGETPIDFLFTVHDGRDKVIEGQVTDLALAKNICERVIENRVRRNARLATPAS